MVLDVTYNSGVYLARMGLLEFPDNQRLLEDLPASGGLCVILRALAWIHSILQKGYCRPTHSIYTSLPNTIGPLPTT